MTVPSAFFNNKATFRNIKIIGVIVLFSSRKSCGSHAANACRRRTSPTLPGSFAESASSLSRRDLNEAVHLAANISGRRLRRNRSAAYSGAETAVASAFFAFADVTGLR
jgi:hypothetical protein